MATYLKDIIGMTPDGILTAKINSIGSPEQNKNGKYFRKVEFLFPATGKTISEGVFEFNFKENGSMNGLKVGDSIEMKLEGGWPVYKILPNDGTGQSQNNSQQVRSERVATEAIRKDDEKGITIHLNGLFQAYVSNPSRILINSSHESIIADALTFAVKAREAIIKKAAEIHAGIPAAPTHSPAQVAEVNNVFGADQSAPLPQSKFEDNYHPDQDLNQ